MDYNSVLWANILQQRNLKKGTISQTCIDPFYTLHEASRLHFTCTRKISDAYMYFDKSNVTYVTTYLVFEFPRVSSRSSDPQTS
ncbi:hypothetical protein Hanom_Chr11g00984151 [Helianthus anomalus]